MPAGEAVQSIKEIRPAGEIVADMMEEARSIIKRREKTRARLSLTNPSGPGG
jgi:hypothetical protein